MISFVKMIFIDVIFLTKVYKDPFATPCINSAKQTENDGNAVIYKCIKLQEKK